VIDHVTDSSAAKVKTAVVFSGTEAVFGKVMVGAVMSAGGASLKSVTVTEIDWLLVLPTASSAVTSSK